ncbi:hypothetical protein AVEN_217442-1 [Araneus ventricosus]|uniref:SWIM-type domain-containing protein n=1 Tax=Araneus ventricosus TaxID=182803 RepID=A0A4Y2BDR3_ARAVE|nr:hypothetical protein AVEN_217442-1 [Araneus ventricosus]
MENYYCNRLTEFANNRNSALRLLLLSLKKKAAYLQAQQIEKLNENTFLVPSEKGEPAFTVNVKSGCCTCNAGMYGKLCKHQYAVYLFYELALQNCSVAPKVKHQIACLALGEKAPPLSFYQLFLLGNKQATDNSEVMTNEDESLRTVEIQNEELPDLDCPSVERNDDLFEIVSLIF